MKKALSFLIIICLVAMMGAFTVSAAEPTILWDFNSDAAMEDVMSSPNVLEWEAKDFYYIFTAKGPDPFVTMNTPADDVAKVWWAKARVMNVGKATAIELFGATDGRGLSGPECTHIDITPNSNEWKEYVIYIPDANVKTANEFKGQSLTETYWAGTVESIRLDAMFYTEFSDDGATDNGGNMADGDQIYIDYIAFFPDEASAKAYQSPAQIAEAAAAAAAAPAETEAPAAAAEAPAETTAPVVAAQTSDIASIAVVAAVLALGTAVVVSKKRG